MRQWLLALAGLAFTAAAARAHFIWIVPDKDGATAQVVFSDSLAPDDPKLLDRITKTDRLLRQADGRTVPLEWAKGDDAYLVKLPAKAPLTVGAVCRYGVIQ